MKIVRDHIGIAHLVFNELDQREMIGKTERCAGSASIQKTRRFLLLAYSEQKLIAVSGKLANGLLSVGQKIADSRGI
ncbi:MAG: hypothetical protein ACAI35_25245, partial [Candidatus Methylacidiphilales bacterium]